MKAVYKYSSKTAFTQDKKQTNIGFGSDLSRSMIVSLDCRLRNNIQFRDLLLSVKDVVYGNFISKKKLSERKAYYKWLDGELDRLTLEMLDMQKSDHNIDKNEYNN